MSPLTSRSERWIEVIDCLKTNKADESRIVAAPTAKLPRQELLLELRTEALDRLSADDTDVAITAAGTLLEAICKMALRETKNPYPEGADLPKLYCLASAALGLSAGPRTTETVKSMLGATAAFVAAVAELRKQVDDSRRSRRPSVNATLSGRAGSKCCRGAGSISDDCHRTLHRGIGPDGTEGRAILKSDTTMIRACSRASSRGRCSGSKPYPLTAAFRGR